MYICNKCGTTFSEPEVEHGYMNCEYWGAKCYMDDSTEVCPECHSEDFEEAEQCEWCGEWFSQDELNGCNVCEDCECEAETRFRRALRKEFSKEETELLFDMICNNDIEL